MDYSETKEPALKEPLGYLQLDLAVGKWLAWDDVARFTHVGHPEQDDKLHVRELLRIFGKRFATAEAELIWQQVEEYRDRLTQLYGPAIGAVGKLNFEQAAQEWYTAYGRQFEKAWYLQAPLDLHFARSGHEYIRGRWLRLLHPDLQYFVEGGFSAGEVLDTLILRRPGGSIWQLWSMNRPALARFWVKLAAYLMDFPLEIEAIEQALAEITEHAARLGRRKGYPVETAAAALDYFRRLQMAGLGSEVIFQS